jgi:hypothetical protein
MELTSLEKFGKIYPIALKKYELFNPSGDDTDVIGKVNSIIDHLNKVNKLSSEVVVNWNKVMQWVLEEGLTDGVKTKVDEMIASGLFDEIINTVLDGMNTEVTTKLDGFETSLAENTSKLNGLSVDVVTDFNAVGNGIADDTTPIQNAINYIETTFGDKGGTVIIPMGYTFKISSVRVKSKHVRITGGGTIDGQILLKSVDSADPNSYNLKELFTVIENLRFVNTGTFTGSAGVRIQYMRNATIKGCYFENYDVGILGESLVEDFKWQQTARVLVSDCLFYDVDYCVKTQWKEYYAGISPNWVYHQHGDWQVINCQGYFMKVDRGKTHFYFTGQDGLLLNHNVCFHHQFTGQTQRKEYCLYLKQTNYTIITNNLFFESGYEAIYSEDHRMLNIQNNHLTRIGQRKPSSGIFIETKDMSTQNGSACVIKGNTISGATKYGVEIGYNPIKVQIEGNSLFSLGDSSYYYGTDAISANIYGVRVLNSGPFTNSETIVSSQNLSDRPELMERGLSMSAFRTSYVSAKATFGNVTTLASATTNILDFKATIGGSISSAQPFNPNFPYTIKNITGTLSDITNAGTNQILVMVVGGAGLTVTHSVTGANKIRLKAKTNQTLTQYDTITLIHTDDIWVEI